jgi:hypothetical protein
LATGIATAAGSATTTVAYSGVPFSASASAPGVSASTFAGSASQISLNAAGAVVAGFAALLAL